jgi:hypothetical protein
MGYSCSDFTDDIVRALNIDTDKLGEPDCEVQPSDLANAALTEIQRLQDLEAARKLADANGGTWGEHHTYTPADWRLAVENHDTRSSYWGWVLAQIEREKCDGGEEIPDHA